MEHRHYCHPHPLKFSYLRPEYQACYACKESIFTKTAYSCSQCKFFLHILCADAPPQLENSDHPQHKLTLLTESPDASDTCICNQCRSKCHGFTYHCETCSKFGIHLQCAMCGRGREHRFKSSDYTPTSSPERSSSKDNSANKIYPGITKVRYQIKRHSHRHDLYIHEAKDDCEVPCSSCSQPLSSDLIFGCSECGFFLDRFCSLKRDSDIEESGEESSEGSSD